MRTSERASEPASRRRPALPAAGSTMAGLSCDSWYLVYGRLPLEVIAEVEGIALDPPALPEPSPSRFAAAHDALVSVLEASERGYAVDVALRLASYVRELDRRGARVAEEDADELADELAALLGRRIDDPLAADAALEVRAAVADRDESAAIVRHLHRRTLRHEALLGPAMRELAGVAFQRIRC